MFAFVFCGVRIIWFIFENSCVRSWCSIPGELRIARETRNRSGRRSVTRSAGATVMVYRMRSAAAPERLPPL
ncbi:hypothetical protein OCAR_6524 [Afipia carboxidovorans OM5]|nr:hypothetical protein OCAR_6524 [Afipia carboxidovorans OM5]